MADITASSAVHDQILSVIIICFTENLIHWNPIIIFCHDYLIFPVDARFEKEKLDIIFNIFILSWMKMMQTLLFQEICANMVVFFCLLKMGEELL